MEDYPSDISYPIYKAHFAEIVLQFSESERLALTHIYGLVDALNANFSIIRSNWDTLSGDEISDHENLRKAIQISQGAYTNARVADVMIELLLERAGSRAPATRQHRRDIPAEDGAVHG